VEGEAKSLVREMMASIETWVNEIVAEAETVTVAAAASGGFRDTAGPFVLMRRQVKALWQGS